MSFLENGSVAIFDKEVGQDVFQHATGGQRALVIDDPSDTWGNGVQAYDKVIGAFGAAEIRVLENGPVRASVRIRTTYHGSSLETDWLLYAGSHCLEARVALDWHEHLKMLKFSYPINIQAAEAAYEIPYGHITRQTTGLEEPGQRWVDVSGTRDQRQYGLAVINDAKYGYSVLGSDLRVSIVRGVVYAWEEPSVGKLKPDGVYHWQDQGVQSFRIRLIPHTGTWQESGVVRATEEFTTVVPTIYQGIHPGRRPQTASFLSVDVPNVVVSVLKKAEEGDDLILRCYETAGQATTAAIELGLVNQHWKGHLRPSEIKTLRIPLKVGPIDEVDALE